MMSAEFDHFIAALSDIKADIDEPKAFTIAERTALDLLLESLKERNQRLLKRVR